MSEAPNRQPGKFYDNFGNEIKFDERTRGVAHIEQRGGVTVRETMPELPRKLQDVQQPPNAGLKRMVSTIGAALEREEVQDRLINLGIGYAEKQLGISRQQKEKQKKSTYERFLNPTMKLIVLLFVLMVLWRVSLHFFP